MREFLHAFMLVYCIIAKNISYVVSLIKVIIQDLLLTLVEGAHSQTELSISMNLYSCWLVA